MKNFSQVRTLVISLSLVVFYGGMIVLAAPLYQPGDTLDPTCVPSTTDCTVNIPSGSGISIGDPVGNSPDNNGVLYVDGTGNVKTDSLFTRDASTHSTTIEHDDGAKQFKLVAQSDANGFIPSAGNFYGDTGVNTFTGVGDLTGFGGEDHQFFNYIIDSTNNVTVAITGGPTQGVNAIYRDLTNNINPIYSSITASPSHIGIIHNTGNGNGESGLYTSGDDLILKSRGNAFTLPQTNGTNGDVLTTDGSGNLSWAAASGGGGGSLVGSTDSIVNETWLGVGAGSSSGSTDWSVFLGRYAGVSASGADKSVFVGPYAGQSATSATASNFIGWYAGKDATNADHSIFIGGDTGETATHASFSNFIGLQAGLTATNATYSNFLGISAGQQATNASYSNFIGDQAGYLAASAAHSIFIGYQAGLSDTVDNTVSGTSILIGDNTSTGGFSNSIAIGNSATNTAADQFLIDDSYTNWSIRGVNYVMPGSQGGVGEVLTNDGSGNLSWAAASGGGGGGSYNYIQENYSYGSTTASGTGSVSIGRASVASGQEAFAIGINNQAQGVQSFALGISSTASGQNAVTFGSSATSSGQSATSFGYGTSASGDDSTAFGSSTTASGREATSFGRSTTAPSWIETAFGFNNTNYTPSGTGFGQWYGTDRLLVIGNGNSGNSDAFTILKNAKTGIGYSNFEATSSAALLQVNGSILQTSATSCSLSADTDGTIICTPSDFKLKQNISDITYGLDTVMHLHPVSFTFKDSHYGIGKQIGFIAQELEQYIPELVTQGSQYKSVNYALLTSVNTKAIQELNIKIDNLENLESIDNSFASHLRGWLASTTNGITNIFSKKITTQEICVQDTTGETCLTRAQINQLIQNQH